MEHSAKLQKPSVEVARLPEVERILLNKCVQFQAILKWDVIFFDFIYKNCVQTCNAICNLQYFMIEVLSSIFSS